MSIKLRFMKSYLSRLTVLISVLAVIGCTKEKEEGYIPSKNVPEGAVDMGTVMTREDGTKYKVFWAECNVGASSPEEYGDYFAWGEVKPKKEYTKETYKWSNGIYDEMISAHGHVKHLILTKYCPSHQTLLWGLSSPPDGKTEFSDYDYVDDAARVRLGGKWRTPTAAELSDLWRNSSITYEYKNGHRCLRFGSRITRQCIYLPLGGYGEYNSKTGREYEAYYMSSSIVEANPDLAYILARTYHGSVIIGMGSLDRDYGVNVRPVIEE